MASFEADEFIERVVGRMPDSRVPTCPYCGGEKFTTLGKFVSLLIGDNLGALEVGPSVPAGMIICENCGYIALFSLGVLGMLPDGEADTDGK